MRRLILSSPGPAIPEPRHPGLEGPGPGRHPVNANYIDGGITSRFIVSAKATSLGGGLYHYEYAVYNHNANRSGGSFSIPHGPGVNITNIGFHAPFSHSGEPYDNTAWTSAVGADRGHLLRPSPVNPAENTNAIRWGTLYNFRFDANIAPVTGVGHHRPLHRRFPLLRRRDAASPSPAWPASATPTATARTAPPILNVNDFICFQNSSPRATRPPTATARPRPRSSTSTTSSAS